MEFPDLGGHCSDPTCNQLDFLPMKCDACDMVFCKDHFQYGQHNCEKAHQRDIQVPVCPLCNKPVPVKRGEPPDIKVGKHIDMDCQSDPAAKRKIYTNRCSLKGCKQKELVPVTCSQCKQNYCLKHRHPIDHSCQGLQGNSRVISPMGAAALARAKNKPKPSSSLATKTTNNSHSRSSVPSHSSSINNTSVIAIQGNLNEDEALAIALQQSVLRSQTADATRSPVNQEDEDEQLALALAESERTHQQGQRVHPSSSR
ncbi:AN1-type zinc finger protein 2A-like isoform X2 [Tachypleus tridentatus]|uniref:AN1-type zinc finger protein 2A-like isoform X2 n=1 Tax=Tachypleus tridentatus TaxID=6853 RepID=UPI003FD2EF57